MVTVRGSGHTAGVRRSSVVLVVGGLVVCVLAAAAVLLLGTPDPSPASASNALTRVDDDEHDEGPGFGPPSWSHAGGRGQVTGERHAWQEVWQALTPAQRSRTMAALARAHEEGMHAWNRCVRDAAGDRAQAQACEKPLPPGLAKKQP